MCGQANCVDLPFCSKPRLFMSHKLRGSFLALPALHYLRDFLSLALSIILGCMFLSQGMESVMLLSRVQQKREKKKPRKWSVLESRISFGSRTQQAIWNLEFSALPWQHWWLFLGHSLPTLSRGMHGFCRDLPQVCCWGDVVKIPTAACLSAGEPCLHCESLKRRQLRLHGFVVFLPFLSPREAPEIFLQMLSHGSGHEELSAVWRRLGLCWFSQIGWGSALFSLRQVMGLKTPVWKERWHFPQESEAPVIISTIRDSLCRVSPPGTLYCCWLSKSEQLRFSQFHFCPWQACPLVPGTPSALKIPSTSLGLHYSLPCTGFPVDTLKRDTQSCLRGAGRLPKAEVPALFLQLNCPDSCGLCTVWWAGEISIHVIFICKEIPASDIL